MNDTFSRFLDIFARIEEYLRQTLDVDKHTQFVQMVNDLAPKSPAVRQHKTALREFAALRNLMVHGYRKDAPLVILTEQAVKEIEGILEVLVTPPRLTPVFRRTVETCGLQDPVIAALGKMYQHGYSKLPIYKGSQLINLLYAETIPRWLASRWPESEPRLTETVESILKYQPEDRQYATLGENATMFDALAAFDHGYRTGKPLNAIIITPSGGPGELPAGIVTPSDIPRMLSLVKASDDSGGPPDPPQRRSQNTKPSRRRQGSPR
jgi:hypothetical protein